MTADGSVNHAYLFPPQSPKRAELFFLQTASRLVLYGTVRPPPRVKNHLPGYKTIQPDWNAGVFLGPPFF